MRRWSAGRSHADLERTTEEDKYRKWRSRELRRQLTNHFDMELIPHRDVLDFGCGTGELCAVLSSFGPKTLLGVDRSTEAIGRAAASFATTDLSARTHPRFICNEQHDDIPVERESVDLICCFDVVEHIVDMRRIAREWVRILRPAGLVWIWWSPWRGPYGHHLESLVPLPWVHLVLSERTVFAACAELYEDSDFVPRIWDRDPVTGHKKPNKWRHTDSFRPFLNRLAARQFERIVRGAGLRIARRKAYGFSGSHLRKATRILLPIPVLGDCFVSHYIYELSKR